MVSQHPLSAPFSTAGRIGGQGAAESSVIPGEDQDNNSSSTHDHAAIHHDHSTPSFNLETARREILQIWMHQEAKSPQQHSRSRAARYCCFTYHDAVRAYQSKDAAWYWLDQELSSNVAGETGAVHVYKGALAASHYVRPLPRAALDFCHEHQHTEGQHLALFTSLVPNSKRTRLLPIWRVAGWMVGFLPTAFAGSKGLYVTVEAIESFVEEHFQEQIQTLENEKTYQDKDQQQQQLQQQVVAPELLKILQYCCADEVHHKEEAAAKLLQGDHTKEWWMGPWSKIVHWGSATAAEIARRV